MKTSKERTKETFLRGIQHEISVDLVNNRILASNVFMVLSI